MNHSEKLEVQKQVNEIYEDLQVFFKKRDKMSALEQFQEVRKLKAETQKCYSDAFIKSKEDPEKAFEYCQDSMILIQHYILTMTNI